MRLLWITACTLIVLSIACSSHTATLAMAAGFSCAEVNDISVVECEALVDIYNSTNGSNWDNNNGWLASDTPCSWYGVSCYSDYGNFAKYIGEINLSGNNLQGSLPSSIGDITDIQGIWLSNNQLTSIPPEIGDHWILTNLYLDSNKLTSIPPEIVNLGLLHVLNLSDNQLKNIPPEIGGIPLLEALYLSNNDFTSIPNEVFYPSPLRYLDISGNQLTTLPPGIGKLEWLWELRLNDNQLVSLPPEIENLTMLKVFDLSHNQLKNISHSFNQMSQLETLYLNNNLVLTGPLPETLLPLSLVEFRFDQTNLCVPRNGNFQAWLISIAHLETSGLSCEAITGRVVKDGFGLSSVNLELTLDGIQVNSATTDANGNYHFDMVDAGAYVVKPIRLGYNFLPISQAITIPPSVENINFQATAISTTYAIDGSISENGFAMPGVTVYISTGGIQLASTTTNSSGEYVFSNLEAEQYTITVERSGYTFSPTSQDITVPPDQSNVDFYATEIPSTYNIQGVVAESGFGLSGVTVRISTGGIQFASTSTNASGEYAFTNLDAEQYTLAVERNGFTFSPTSQDINVPPDQANVNFEASAIPSTYSIRGSVSEDGFALSGVTVNLSTGGIQVASTTTDGFGEYTFTDLDAQLYSIRVEHSSYTFSPAAREITVPPDQSNVNFEASAIQTSFSIRGLVSENGFAVPGVTVTISTGGIQFASTTTNVKGEYSFANLGAAQYTLVVEKSGYTFSPASQDVSVPPDQTGVNFEASAVQTAFSIRGSVSENGFAVPGVTVNISTGGIQFDSQVTGINGSYAFVNLGAGEYTVSVERSGYTFSPASTTVTVPPDRMGVDFDGTADVSAKYSVSGKVSANGVGLGDVTVRISAAEQLVGSTVTVSDGSYKFENVEAGLYVITAERVGYNLSEARTIVMPPDGVNQDFVAVDRGRRPVIILPGFAGSYLKSIQSNQSDCVDAEVTEIWPNLGKLGWQGSSHLRRLQLQDNGVQPKSACDVMKADGVWDEVFGLQDMYGKLIKDLTEHGYHVIPCGYDWRRFLDGNGIAGADERDSLLEWIEENCIKPALEEYSAQQVDIIAHSTGGLLARAYVLSSPERENVVNTIVSLGTPYLGTLRPFVLLRYGNTMITGLDELITPGDLTQAAINWPALYQLMPSERWLSRGMAGGYFRQGVAGKPDYKSYSTFAEMEAFLESHYNEDLVGTADRFHSGSMDNWNGNRIETRYFVFVGTRIETPFIIHETTVQGFGESTPSLDYWTTPVFGGDGTVALSSANLNYGELAGDATICTYVGVDHGHLTSNRTVLDDLKSALSRSAFGSGRCESANQMASESRAQAEEIMERRQLVVWGDAQVDIWDSEGRHSGPTSNSLLVEQNIPLVTYWADKHKSVVSLEPGQLYTVTIQPRVAFPLDVRLSTQLLREASEGTISETVIFQGIPVHVNDRLMFVIQPLTDLSKSTLEIDQNQDGIGELLVQPTAVLDAEDSADQVPPVSHIEVQGEQDGNGNFIGTVTVSLAATDEGAGVQQIEYSVDGGLTGVVYTAPFAVEVGDVRTLYVQAVDRAGNAEYPWIELSFVRPQEMSTFLPLVSP